MFDPVKICNRIIEVSFYWLFFLTPLILTPFNYELFEFNKITLVYLLALLINCAWLIKSVIHRKLIFRRTFWDIPLILFLLSQLLSTVFSLDPHTSLWGYYSRFHGGLFSTLAYLALYWAFVSNYDQIKNTKKILRAGFVQKCLLFILVSGGLVSVYGVLEHFGIDADYWVQDVQSRVFSTLGQPNWLAAYLVTVIPLAWALTIKFKKSGKEKSFGGFSLGQLFGFSTSALFYLCLLYTKSRSGIVGFTAVYAVFWVLVFFTSRQTKKAARSFNKSFLVVGITLAVITGLIGTPWTPNLGQISKTPEVIETEAPATTDYGISESGDIRKIVWRGAINIWKHYPIFGSGTETFAYSYYRFRPREHNDLSEWDFLYNKAHNEYLNFAATTGTFGLASYLLLIISFLYWSLKQNKNLDSQSWILNSALLSGFIGILVTNFFGFSVVATGLLFFLFPALAVSQFSKPKSGRPIRPKKIALALPWQWAAIALILSSFLVSNYYLLKFWYADKVFASGEKFSLGKQDDQAVTYLEKAIRLRPSEPLFHNTLALPTARLARLAFSQDQATLSAELAEVAALEADLAVKMNPFHLNYWKNRVRVFFELAEIDEKYLEEALQALAQATQLAPTDAKVFYNLGLIYGRLGMEKEAIETLEKTIELRPNYTDAHYALALFYEQGGEIEKARQRLEYVLEKIDSAHKGAQEKLEELQL